MSTVTLIPTDARDLALTQLALNPDQPRQTIDPVYIKELAAAIKESGWISPLLVRPLAEQDDRRATGAEFEIVAGECRYHAASSLKLARVPCTVDLKMDDRRALIIALKENTHRRNVHPLDEATAIQKLIIDGDAASVAEELGVKVDYVYSRLKLLQLIPVVRQAFSRGAIKIGHATAIAGVAEEFQLEALIACFFPTSLQMLDGADGLTVQDAITAGRWDLLGQVQKSTDEVTKWVKHHTTPHPKDVQVQMIPGLSEVLDDSDGDQATLLSVDATLRPSEARALGVLHRRKWMEVNEEAVEETEYVSRQRCDKQRDGVIWHGAPTPRLVLFCRDRACEVHRPRVQAADVTASGVEFSEPQSDIDAANEAAQKAEQAAAEQWSLARREFCVALAKQVATVRPTRAMVVELVQYTRIVTLEEEFGLKCTDKTAALFLILDRVPTWAPVPTAPRLVSVCKALGLTPAQWAKRSAPRTAKRRPVLVKKAARTSVKNVKATAKARRAMKGGR